MKRSCHDERLVEDWYRQDDVVVPIDPLAVIFPQVAHTATCTPTERSAKRARSEPRRVSGGALLRALERSDRPPLDTAAITRSHPLLRAVEEYVTQTAAPDDDQQRVPRVALESVTKAYEDSMLRPPRDQTEQPCVAGALCEGVRMAAMLPNARAEDGFVVVRFTSPGGVRRDSCLLCMRKAVATAWYNCAATNHIMSEPSQPHRVLVGVPGEYDEDACFECEPRLGVTDPFVKHERHRYEYVLGPTPRIRQRLVNFRLAPDTRDVG